MGVLKAAAGPTGGAAVMSWAAHGVEEVRFYPIGGGCYKMILRRWI